MLYGIVKGNNIIENIIYISMWNSVPFVKIKFASNFILSKSVLKNIKNKPKKHKRDQKNKKNLIPII